MSSFFAPIYEFFLYDSNYQLIFNCLYYGNGYALLGLSLIFIPLLFFAFYYYDSYLPWGNPYRKKYTWFIWLAIIVGVIIGTSYGIVYSSIFGSNDPIMVNALNAPATNDFASQLVIKQSILNGAYSLLVGFLWSLLLKLKSVLHIHIPF